MERPPPKSDVPGTAARALPGSGILDDELEFGRVVGVFGFRGEVRLHLHNPASTLFEDPLPAVLVAPDGRRWGVELATRSGAGQRVLGRIGGVTDDVGARALNGWTVAVGKAALPAPADDEFYVWQLEGLAVEIEGRAVGRVASVQRAGPNDILEIALDGEGPDRAVFVPLVKEHVAAVDVAGGRITLHPGAIDPDEGEGGEGSEEAP